MHFEQFLACGGYDIDHVHKAVDKVREYDDIIEETANRYNMDKAILQAIIYHEVLFTGIDDVVGDLAYNTGIKKDNSFGIGQIKPGTAMEAYNWYINNSDDLNWNDPSLSALKEYGVLQSDSEQHKKAVVELLNNPETCIDMMGIILCYRAATNNTHPKYYDENGKWHVEEAYDDPITISKDMSDEDVEKLIGAYNSPADADRAVMSYSEEGLRNYKYFQEYNENHF